MEVAGLNEKDADLTLEGITLRSANEPGSTTKLLVGIRIEGLE
jgi:hypothetical protein